MRSDFEMPNRKRWLSRTVLGIGLASFFSDLGHEAATAILPMFLVSIGAAPAALGIIEGVSDAISSFAKLWSGWYSDRLVHRKPMAVTGYILTGIAKASFAFATSWVQILFGRTIGWLGRGIRGPVRDSILTDAVPAEVKGRAFGFDRALDTLGAVLGPVAALWLISLVSFRTVFLLTLIPGICAALAFGMVVQERRRETVQPKNFRMSLSHLPKEFKRFLVAVGVFGAGDFAHTLLILRAAQLFTSANVPDASQRAVTLYIIHNIIYAAASYPIGAIADRMDKRFLLFIGYVLAGLMCFGFLYPTSDYGFLILLFSVGGIYIAIEDTVERALAAEMLPSDIRGTGFGVLAGLNGIGDFISSTFVGIIWTTVSVNAGFVVSGSLSIAGAFLLLLMVPSLKSRKT